MPHVYGVQKFTENIENFVCNLISQQCTKTAILGFTCSLLRKSLNVDPIGSRALYAKILCPMFVADSSSVRSSQKCKINTANVCFAFLSFDILLFLLYSAVRNQQLKSLMLNLYDSSRSDKLIRLQRRIS